MRAAFITVGKGMNAALAFALELVALAAVAAWGWSLPTGTVPRVAAAAASTVLMAAAWGRYAAPRAPAPLRGRRRIVFQAAWFGIGVATLLGRGRVGQAVVMAIAVVVNLILANAWQQH